MFQYCLGRKAKYLNVMVDEQIVDINVTGLAQLSNVVVAVKSFFGIVCPPCDIYLMMDNVIVHDLKTIPKQYYWKPSRPGALVLKVHYLNESFKLNLKRLSKVMILDTIAYSLCELAFLLDINLELGEFPSGIKRGELQTYLLKEFALKIHKKGISVLVLDEAQANIDLVTFIVHNSRLTTLSFIISGSIDLGGNIESRCRRIHVPAVHFEAINDTHIERAGINIKALKADILKNVAPGKCFLIQADIQLDKTLLKHMCLQFGWLYHDIKDRVNA